MDLDEWEYLPDDAFLDFHDQTEKKALFSKRYFDSTSVFNMYHDYYLVQSPNNSSSSNKLAAAPVVPAPPNQLHVPVQIQLLPPPTFVRSTQTPEVEPEADQDPLLSQVHFKKNAWEPESVDMKMDSPKSPTRGGLGFGAVHQTSSDSTAGGAKFEFDDYSGEAKVSSPRMKTNRQEEEDEQGMKKQKRNIWKLSFTGIGAICSFGFAAATICILFLGRHQSNHKHLQIYSEDSKRIKEVVHRATKYDEAFSAVRGVPLCRAHITSGGYYTSAL